MTISPKTSNSLIIISLLLLAYFLIQWNYKQYHLELGLLQKKVVNQYKLSQGEIRDSLLQLVLQNVLGDQVNERAFKDGIMASIPEIDEIEDPGVSFIELQTINLDDVNKKSNSVSILSLHENLKNIEAPKYSLSTLREKLDERLESENILNQFQYKINLTKVENNQGNQKNQYPPQDIEISEYAIFILKRIWPSIMMSLLLFLLLSSSFYFLNRSRKEQESMNILKNDFISNMNHELKTPISTISVALEALSNFGEISNPRKTVEYLDISKQELKRLHLLVDKVLNMSCFDKQGMKLKEQTIDMSLLMSDIMKAMKLVFDKNKVQIDIRKKGDNFTTIGDKVHLTNVIYNLLDNAIKYSTHHPSIKVILEENENVIILKIVDKGIGIPKKYIPHVFDRFFRVPQNDIHNAKGYGLGLHYVKEVVEKHLAKIKVESIEHQGTTIHLTFKKRKLL